MALRTEPEGEGTRNSFGLQAGSAAHGHRKSPEAEEAASKRELLGRPIRARGPAICRPAPIAQQH
eukprot:15437052-Alexandrium_andersonii.AAC.1